MRATVRELKARNRGAIEHYIRWNLQLELRDRGVCDKCPYALARLNSKTTLYEFVKEASL